jgi:hypothetical protein
VDGHNKCSALTDVTPLLNLENQSCVRVLLIVSSSKASLNILGVAAAVLLSVKQNFMHFSGICHLLIKYKLYIPQHTTSQHKALLLSDASYNSE